MRCTLQGQTGNTERNKSLRVCAVHVGETQWRAQRTPWSSAASIHITFICSYRLSAPSSPALCSDLDSDTTHTKVVEGCHVYWVRCLKLFQYLSHYLTFTPKQIWLSHEQMKTCVSLHSLSTGVRTDRIVYVTYCYVWIWKYLEDTYSIWTIWEGLVQML